MMIKRCGTCPERITDRDEPRHRLGLSSPFGVKTMDISERKRPRADLSAFCPVKSEFPWQAGISFLQEANPLIAPPGVQIPGVSSPVRARRYF